jgi:hypothetical protein
MVAILVTISLFATYFFMDGFNCYNFIIFNRRNILVKYIRKNLEYFEHVSIKSTNKNLSIIHYFQYNNICIHILNGDVIVLNKKWESMLNYGTKQSKQLYNLLIEKHPYIKR